MMWIYNHRNFYEIFFDRRPEPGGEATNLGW